MLFSHTPALRATPLDRGDSCYRDSQLPKAPVVELAPAKATGFGYNPRSKEE